VPEPPPSTVPEPAHDHTPAVPAGPPAFTVTGRQVAALGMGVTVAWAALIATAPFVLVNTTPSEPPGVYIGSRARPAVGQLVAFRAPPTAFPYADQDLKALHRIPILKAVAAAGPGDVVCTTSGRLVINGRDRSPIALVDRQGRALPHWRGCRALGADELFVFSDRAPNSFDSRYFGPVSRAAVLGVYRPLLIANGGR
jgi:conjugative transfer signal peptidase TraF